MAENAANDWTATFSDPVLTSTGAVSGTMDTDTGTAGAQTTIGVDVQRRRFWLHRLPLPFQPLI